MPRLLATLVVLFSVVGCASSYSMSVLPLDAAFAINASGAIAGRVGGNAAVYTQGNVVLLPGKAGYSALTATDIADNGFIVGFGLSAGSQRGLFWSSTTAAPIDMGALGGVVSPMAVNSQGVTVGFYVGPGGLPQAFRWSPTTGMTDIAPAATLQSRALDISETGYIAGLAHYESIDRQAIRWNLDGSASRIADGLAERARRSGSVFGSGAGGATLWTLLGAAILIGPHPATHFVKQMSAAGRSVGFTVDELTAPRRAWTTRGSNTPLYLPLPAGARGVAYDVDTCGTILGSVRLSTNVEQFVIWSRLTCDLLPPVPTQ